MSPFANEIVSMMPHHQLGAQFAGFAPPTSNYYRLPNDWFDIWRAARETLAEGDRPARIVAPLKITEYVIKHSWGWQNFNDPIRLSRSDMRQGRQGKNGRLDAGTGLGSEATISRGIELAINLGLLEQIAHNQDAARQERYYLPRLDPQAVDDIPTESAEFVGFSTPTQNYFVVPKSWSDTAAGIRSEVLILSIEYLFRHTWGWQLRDGQVRWLDADEVTNGRRYRSAERQGERYDAGTGYSVRQVRSALSDGVERGLLVWRSGADGQREYALRMDWMRGIIDGHYETADDVDPIQPEKLVGGVRPATRSAEKSVGGQEKTVEGTEKSVDPTEKPVGVREKGVDPAEKDVDRTYKDTSGKTPTPNPSNKTAATNHRAAPVAAAENSQQDDHTIYFRAELENGNLSEAHPITVSEAAEIALVQPGAFYWSITDLQSPRDLDSGEPFSPDEITAQVSLDAAIFDNDHAVITDGEQFQRRQLLDLAQRNTAVIHDVWQLFDLPRPPNLELALAKRRQRLDQLREQHTVWGHPDLSTALEKIGIAPTDAQRLVAQHGLGLVGSWLRAVRQRSDRLQNPAGLLIAKLRAGETPPGGPMAVADTISTSTNPLAHINHLLTQLLDAVRQLDAPQFTPLAATLETLQEAL